MSNLLIVTLIGFVLFMSTGITGPVNSIYYQSLGASYVAIGMLGTINSLTMVVFSYFWGRASDLLGRRKVFLLGGLAGVALAYGLMALAPQWGYLVPIGIIANISSAAYGTANLALMGDLLEQRGGGRGRRMGLFRGLGSLGFGLMAFTSGTLAALVSLRLPFGLAAGLAALAFLLALRVREPDAASSPAAARSGVRAVPAFLWSVAHITASGLGRTAVDLMAAVRHKPGQAASGGASLAAAEGPRLPLAPPLISALLWSLVTGAVYAVWANYMVNEIHYSAAQMTRIWAVASLSEFPLMILAGWLSDRTGRLPMLSLGFVAWAVVFLGYVGAPLLPWILLIQLVRGFAYSAFTATAMTYATEVRGRSQRGHVAGLYSSASGVGSILGAAVGGALTQYLGFRTMFSLMAAVIMAGAVYLAVMAARHLAAVRRARAGETAAA
jgi:MFS family permease